MQEKNEKNFIFLVKKRFNINFAALKAKIISK